MESTRRYNRNYAKRLREQRSRAGKESQRIQALKREAQAGQWDSIEDALWRAKQNRRGSVYRHLVACDSSGAEALRMILIHARYPARSDQFTVMEFKRAHWQDGLWVLNYWPQPLAMGAILKQFQKRFELLINQK